MNDEQILISYGNTLGMNNLPIDKIVKLLNQRQKSMPPEVSSALARMNKQ